MDKHPTRVTPRATCEQCEWLPISKLVRLCPLHAAAERLKEFVEDITKAGCETDLGCTRDIPTSWHCDACQAQALLDNIDGTPHGTTPKKGVS